MPQVNVTIEPEMKKDLEEEAARKGMTVSGLIRNVLYERREVKRQHKVGKNEQKS